MERAWAKSTGLTRSKLPSECREEILDVFLGLFEQRPERLTDVSQTQLVGLTESLPVTFELLSLKLKIGLESATRIRRLRNVPDDRGWFAPEEGHLSSENSSVAELLGEVFSQLLNRTDELGPGDGRDVQVVLNDRLVLSTEVLVQEFSELLSVHGHVPFGIDGYIPETNCGALIKPVDPALDSSALLLPRWVHRRQPEDARDARDGREAGWALHQVLRGPSDPESRRHTHRIAETAETYLIGSSAGTPVGW